MAKRSKKVPKTQEKTGNVVVAFAKDMEQAREYETLLRVNDIPVRIGEPQPNGIGEHEIAVMVPEDYLDEAHVIIESQDAYDDFYDFTMEDEEYLDFDGEFLDDEF